MLKKLSCKHCVGLFQPIRTGHFYCSDTCRKLAFKAKNRAKTQAKRNRKLSEKLKKLANSAFGIYLVKELRRAKTVEILQGHDSETLSALVQLRRLCTSAGGYEDGDSLGYYELSHIYPVSGKDRIGLLNSTNLAITPKTFNRKHGTKTPVDGYMGSSIPKASLLNHWKVPDFLDSLEVLKLARKYIGEEFDVWLKKHLISQTQRSTILKKLKEAGYDSDALKTLGLRELKAIATDEEISYFNSDKKPADLENITLSEMQRLNLNSKLTQILSMFRELDDTFGTPKYEFKGSEKELNSFREFVCHQALLCMHGQTFEREWKDKPFNSLLKKTKKVEYISPKTFDDDDIL